MDDPHKLTGVSVRKLKDGVLKMNQTWSYSTQIPSGGSSARRWGNYAENEFENGEGIIVLNNSSNIFFRISGQVTLEPMYCVPGNRTYSIWGNNTPVNIKLDDIRIFGQDGREYDGLDDPHKLTGVSVRKLKDGALKMGQTWSYSTQIPSGSASARRWGNYSQNIISNGEAVIVLNNSSNVYFRLKSPIAK